MYIYKLKIFLFFKYSILYIPYRVIKTCFYVIYISFLDANCS